jgi:hypothetical protein
VNVIAYETSPGVAIVNPTGEIPLDVLTTQVVPDGVTPYIVDASTLPDPSIDSKYWQIVKGKVTVDTAALALAQAAQEAAAATAAANAAAAIAHAKSLGFTDAMIAAMYPGLITQAP